jgi:hypothetical protein
MSANNVFSNGSLNTAMPAARQSVETLIRNGTFKNDPSRTRPMEPRSDRPIGNAPAWFTVPEKALWKELISNAPDNALCAADRVMLEIVVKLTIKLRANDIKTAEINLLSANLSKLGWSPADRAKVSPVSHKDTSDDLDFLN